MIRYRLRVFVVVGVLLPMLAGCEVEETLRKLVSNRGDRKMVVADAGPAQSGGLAEVEPNDSAEQATPLVLGKELRDIHATIATVDDVDWFALSADDEGTFELTVAPDVSLDAAIHVAVEGGAGLVYDDGRRGGAERIAALKVGRTPLRVGVRAEASSSGKYTISLKRQLGAGSMEAEPNDETNVAGALTLPGTIDGAYDRPDDRDVFRLTGDPNKPYALQIGAVTGLRQIARIFEDPKLVEPALTVQIVDQDVWIPNVAVDPEKPRWLVLTPLGTPRPGLGYRITATAHPPAEVKLELEPNDASAQALEFGEPGESGHRAARVVGYLHSADDRDQFSLAPPAVVPVTAPIPVERDEPDLLASYRTKAVPQVPVDVHLKWVDEHSSFGLRWTNPDGTAHEFRQISPTPEVRACGLSLDQGPAVTEVRVERLGKAPKIGQPQYELIVTESSAGHGFEAEPNDQHPQADALEGTRRGTFAVPDDVDVFAFAVAAAEGEVRKVRVGAAARGVDVVMRVLDDGGGTVANVDNAALGSREAVELDLPAGLYFVELRWKGGDLCVPYEIELAL